MDFPTHTDSGAPLIGTKAYHLKQHEDLLHASKHYRHMGWNQLADEKERQANEHLTHAANSVR